MLVMFIFPVCVVFLGFVVIGYSCHNVVNELKMALYPYLREYVHGIYLDY